MQDERNYVVFDTNIWRGRREFIETYAKIGAHKRASIALSMQTFCEGMCAEPRLAIPFFKRAMAHSERWTRSSDDVLRSICSSIEFNWTEKIDVLMTPLEEQQQRRRAHRLLPMLQRNPTEFAVWRKQNREKRIRLVRENQDVFRKLKSKHGLVGTQKEVSEAFANLRRFEVRDAVTRKFLFFAAPVLFAKFRFDRKKTSYLLDHLEQFIGLKRALFLFGFQFYRQLICCKTDPSFLVDWRIILEVPESGTLITEDRELIEASRSCSFDLGIIELQAYLKVSDAASSHST